VEITQFPVPSERLPQIALGSNCCFSEFLSMLCSHQELFPGCAQCGPSTTFSIGKREPCAGSCSLSKRLAIAREVCAVSPRLVIAREVCDRLAIAREVPDPKRSIACAMQDHPVPGCSQKPWMTIARTFPRLVPEQPPGRKMFQARDLSRTSIAALQIRSRLLFTSEHLLRLQCL